MGPPEIEGVLVTQLKKIPNKKGDVFHCLKKSDPGFMGFGEAYFTKIKSNEIKGWNKHQRMTLNLTVPIGKVVFVIYDNRKESNTKEKFWNVELSENRYRRLTIPPGLWVAFKGKNNGTNIILNLADLEHDPSEAERLDLGSIQYDWSNI